MQERILIIEDEATLASSLKRVFQKEGYEVTTAANAEDGLSLLEEGFYDLVISDIVLPGMSGIEFLKRLHERQPEIAVIIITAYGSMETAVEALRAGAYDYVVKPVLHEEIKQIIRNALKQNALKTENILLKKQIEKEYDFSNIIGSSPAIQKIMNEIKKVANAKNNMLLLGETGTGKELIARAIHYNSNRAALPFIPINCTAIPETLMESELFGHVKGAFTGAVTSKKGLFEEAHSGTVFLDEIGDLSLTLQAKLLRVLEDQEIRPVGSTRSIKVDLRFVCATNRNLQEFVREGKFREDLFYRINAITLNIPPLRDRMEDIDELVSYFISKYAVDSGKQVAGIDQKALEYLKLYSWPGNIRELQNIIERAILITESDTITSEHLPENIMQKKERNSFLMDTPMSIDEYTQSFILKNQSSYTEQELAQMLGITRKALWEKRKRWNLSRK
ncbi:MAG: sigma-54-dependent Fis family transcriptional regulator [Nitrospirae bacterium]|nr:sigma-54-dependent Fis family transcriptional regulator [Nitrospirota bacterium]